MIPRMSSPAVRGLAALAVVGASLFAAVPPAAHAAPTAPLPQAPAASDPTTTHVTMTPASQVVTVDGKRQRLIATASATGPFTMAAISWTGMKGVATFQVRSRTAKGWGAWHTLDVEPDGVSAAERHGRRQGSDVQWFDTSSAAQARILTSTLAPASVTAPQLSLINSVVENGDANLPRTQQDASTASIHAASISDYTYATAPSIISRAGWGADESLLRYNGSGCVQATIDTTIKAAFVHHTAGTNNYTAAQSASIVRGIYAFHVKDRGWCDIGYNFLVDKYGQIFEGRHGGIYNPVHGAHATYWNTDSVGVSVMMDSNAAQPTPAAMTALTNVLAWKLAGNYRPATDHLTLAGKYINRISRHGDVMQTDCPGAGITAYMPTLRQRVAAAMGNWQTPIYQAWQATGGESGFLGSPHIMERPWNGGRTTTFTNGGIFQTPGGQTYWMGPIENSRYLASYASLGWPTGNQVAGPIAGGYQVNFERGTIYASSASGAHSTTGIVDAWLKNNPSQFQKLGYPIAEATGTASAGSQEFLNGTLTWSGTTVKVVYGSGVEGDLNGDRVADVLGVDANGVVSWYPTVGGVSTGPLTGDSLDGHPFTWVGQVPDVNGDGFTELVARRSDGTLWAWDGRGHGTYTNMRQIGRGWGTMRELTVVPDMTHDGLPEIIAIAADGRIIRYGFNRSLNFSSAVLFGRGWGTIAHIATVGDFRHAGVVDVLGIDRSGVMTDYYGTRTGTLSGYRKLPGDFSGYTRVHSIGDVTGDGQWDLTVQSGNGPLMVMPNLGNGTFGPARTLLSYVPAGLLLA